MILATSAIIKVLLVLAVLLLGYRIFRKKLQKKTLVSLGVLILLFAVFANWAVGLVPPLTDTVTLTALGKGREEAENTEIFLKGYTIDGEESLALEDLQISSGHWFWIGDMYCWRPKSDERQPDGVTELVELQIPVGWNRTLNFQSSIYRGEVQIETAENTWVIDTYSEENGEIAEQIGRSSTAALIWNQVLHLEVYALLLAVCFGVTWTILKRVLYSPQKAKSWISRNNGKLMYAGIALFAFVFMFHYANKTSFWVDEFLQISSDGSIWDAIQNCIEMRDATPPLFSICAAIWYHLMPYGEQYLLLLPIIFTVAAIYLIGVVGEQVYGKAVGALSASLLASSTTIWLYVAYEFRSYAFLAFFSILSFYFYVKRNENGLLRSLHKYDWGYSFSVLGLVMSHYFGMLVCIVFVFSDIYLLIEKKIHWKRGLTYIVPGVTSIAWLSIVFFMTLQYSTVESIASWYLVPGIMQIIDIFKYLSGNFDFTYWLFLFGIAIAIFSFCNKDFQWNRFYIIFSLCMIVFTISIMWFYGNFINTESTMWESRYFLVLIPYVVLLSSQVLNINKKNLMQNIKAFNMVKGTICLFLAILCFFNCFSVIEASKSREPWRESADWVYSQGNYIFNNETVILTTTAAEEWSKYYIERKGRRDPLNIIGSREFSKDDINQYNRIYLNYNHTEISSDLQRILDEYYILDQNDSNVNVSVYVRK